MLKRCTVAKKAFRAYSSANLDAIPQIERLSAQTREALRVVASVLPFRTNNYIIEQLIDWENIPDDPIYQLTFPQQAMLEESEYRAVRNLLRREVSSQELAAQVNEIRFQLNPHPAGQLAQNIPVFRGRPVPGLQRKYRETALFFPGHGQTCHAYCTYCFRWAQFVDMSELRFAAESTQQVVDYLRAERELSDLLITGGDPLVMRAKVLRRYVEPLLEPELDHIRQIRFGTKAVAYWPYRFVTDSDADDLLRLFEQIAAAGKHVAIMAHYSHPRELSTPVAEEAVRRLRNAGCEVRVQAPLVRHINDDPEVWAVLWRKAVNLGAIPYYMFVERDTGPRHYFEVPLARASEIFREAYSKVTGLARTVRGPSMSATPGKVQIDGVAEVAGQKVFVLHFLQGRKSAWVRRPFFARYDANATWLSQLKPAFGDKFFFQDRVEDVHDPVPILHQLEDDQTERASA